MTVTLNGTGRRISTHEATVKTAAVYVKALMIEKHQVTLAVFRQLRNENLVDEDTAELHGPAWGTVNYHPSSWSCLAEDQHLHVVWQQGGELRRATVPRDCPTDHKYAKEISDLADAMQVSAEIWVVVSLAAGKTLSCKDGDDGDLVVDVTVDVGGKATLVPVEIPSDSLYTRVEVGSGFEDRYLRRAARAVLQGDPASYRQDLEEAAEKICGQRADPATREMGVLESLLRDRNQVEENRLASAGAWAKQYAALEQLDQLFIAV
jgi:hypothetical protein